METSKNSVILTILTWGALWGIFEAVIGWVLHLLPINVGWLIWYPVACLIMLNVYRKTQQVRSILLVGLVAASIKLLNLFLPGRIDKVLNPAVSILFEAISVAVVLWLMNHYLLNRKKMYIKALLVLGMNTAWRILYMAYLWFFVPDCIQNISVISNSQMFITFFMIQNMITSIILFLGVIGAKYIFKPVKVVERRLSLIFSIIPNQMLEVTKVSLTAFLLMSSVTLKLLL